MIFTHLLRAAFSREPKGTALILHDRIVVQFDPARKHCSMLPTPAIKSFLNFNEIFSNVEQARKAIPIGTCRLATT